MFTYLFTAATHFYIRTWYAAPRSFALDAPTRFCAVGIGSSDIPGDTARRSSVSNTIRCGMLQRTLLCAYFLRAIRACHSLNTPILAVLRAVINSATIV